MKEDFICSNTEKGNEQMQLTGKTFTKFTASAIDPLGFCASLNPVAHVAPVLLQRVERDISYIHVNS